MVAMVAIGLGHGGVTRPVAAAADCAQFVADVTLPDGTQVAPGQRFEKVWRLTNCGDTTWDGYRAVKSDGTFGPEELAIPAAKPGETVDVAAEMDAPATPGEHWASYRLRGPSSSFGGMGIIIDVADCGLAEPPGVRTAGAEARAIGLGREDLGPGWCAVHGDGGRRWSLARYSSAMYGGPRRVLVWTSVWPDVAWAEHEMLLPKGVVATEAGTGFESQSSAWELGDGGGRRGTWKLKGSTLVGIDYVFRVGRTVAWIQVSGEGDISSDLDPQARELVDLQLARMRAWPDLGHGIPTRPTADAVFRALLDASLESSRLPAGSIASRTRTVEPTAEPGVPIPLPIPVQPAQAPRPPARQSSPVGIAEIQVTGSRDAAAAPARILYVVFRTDDEAMKEFVAAERLAYIHLPMSIGHNAICSEGECIALDGNVMVRAFGAPNGMDAPGWAVYDPNAFDTLTLARAGVEHLDAIFDDLLLRRGSGNEPMAGYSPDTWSKTPGNLSRRH
jgi:hypothetical protein